MVQTSLPKCSQEHSETGCCPQFFYYTTCPKCAKHYGKNYVVAFAEVQEA